MANVWLHVYRWMDCGGDDRRHFGVIRGSLDRPLSL